MEERKVSRLVLKENDILVMYLPGDYFNHTETIRSIYRQIKDRLIESGKKNKIIILPKDVEISVMGKEEVKEFVSNVDMWNLFDLDDE